MEITADWRTILVKELKSDYFQKIIMFLEQEKKRGKIIYPKQSDLFNAFNLTPFSNLKVVILGQDPYHGENQAHGLSFSVLNKGKPPPTLRNIFKELQSDVQNKPQSNGNLSNWARQGILMLNATLTVEKGKANSHKGIGWQKFTDSVIQKISNQKEGIIFVLWGNEAIKKVSLIDRTKHYVIQSAHPSPLSAYKGFLGSKPFSKINELLLRSGKERIIWGIQQNENGKIKN